MPDQLDMYNKLLPAYRQPPKELCKAHQAGEGLPQVLLLLLLQLPRLQDAQRPGANGCAIQHLQSSVEEDHLRQC